MTKRAFARIGILIVVLAVPAIAPAEEFVAGKVRPFGTFDFFLPGNAGDGLWQDIQGGMSQLSGVGYSAVGSIETKAALGGRVGVMVQATEAFDIGVSAGYIAGPNSNASITVAGGGNTGVLTDERKVSFARFLIEPTLNVKMSESSAFHLGAGLGIAQGRAEETFACTGSACVTTGNIAKYSSTWNGFAWEVSPYFSTSKLLVGARYAGFPKFKGNATNSKLEWSSFGLFAGLKF